MIFKTRTTPSPNGIVEQEKLRGTSAIPVNMIRIDPRYQRNAPTEREIKALASRWDDKAAHSIVVSLRADGEYWCIDGQRRTAALRHLRGDDALITAHVCENMTAEEEAELFRLLQERKQLTALDVFKADVFSGQQEAVEINEVVKSCGYEIRPSNSSHLKSVSSVTQLRAIYRQHGSARIGRVLGIWSNAKMDSSPPGAALQGLSGFLTRYPHADIERLYQKMELHGIRGLQRIATDLQPTMTGDYAGAWGRAFLLIYNKGLRSGKLPEWAERSWDTPAMRRRKKDGNDDNSGESDTIAV